MISKNNPDIDVDSLMERVHAEVAAMRALSASHEAARSMLSEDRKLPAIVVDLSRHAVVTELVEDASRMSKPRTAVPRRLERAPFSVLRPVVRFGLRALNYIQKDQRHVNAATQQALREILRLSVAIGNHVALQAAHANEQRNVPRDIASLAARLAASEQREAAFFERFGDLDERLAARLQALEEAMTLNAMRIDALETTPLAGRIDALEAAMTINGARADALEAAMTINGARADALEAAMTINGGRAGALETAMTLNAGRLDELETKPVEARLAGLENASTISSQRLERLESLRDESNAQGLRLAETRRELSAERERALRSEASLRSELTAQLNAANALFAQAGASGSSTDRSLALAGSEKYDDVHLAIADRFRGESDAIAAALEHYLPLIRDAGTIDEGHPLVDIGSGRGEWLATLGKAHINAFGIDMNATLVARAREEGLDVRSGDALALLREMPAESVGAVTIFHVIEHLVFEDLITLLDESLRVLVPDGLLACETPNPANVTIGSCNFYLDPTHRQPLPAQLVAHLVELRGFAHVKIDELAPNDAMRIDEDTETARRVNDFFYGPQNYAVIARKPGAFR